MVDIGEPAQDPVPTTNPASIPVVAGFVRSA
jgi:hypothetical protein